MADRKVLEHLLAQEKISRRDFLTYMSALGISATLTPALLATPAHAAKPKKGGRLRLGMAGGSTMDSLDPATIADAMPMNINWQIRNCLVEIDHKATSFLNWPKVGNLLRTLKNGYSNFAEMWNFTMAKPWKQTMWYFP